MQLNKKTQEGLEVNGEALIDYADDLDIDDLADLFGDPIEVEEMDDDELAQMNYLIGWIACLAEVMGVDPVELLSGEQLVGNVANISGAVH